MGEHNDSVTVKGQHGKGDESGLLGQRPTTSALDALLSNPQLQSYDISTPTAGSGVGPAANGGFHNTKTTQQFDIATQPRNSQVSSGASDQFRSEVVGQQIDHGTAGDQGKGPNTSKVGSTTTTGGVAQRVAFDGVVEFAQSVGTAAGSDPA